MEWSVPQYGMEWNGVYPRMEWNRMEFTREWNGMECTQEWNGMEFTREWNGIECTPEWNGSVPQNGMRTSKIVLKGLGLGPLLADVAVLLDGQQERVLGRGKGVVFDRPDDIHELDFGSEGVAVVDDGLAVWAIPAVHCVCVCVCVHV